MENNKESRYLQQLAKEYPTIQSVCTEIINLQAIMNLPKGTEHFISDIHGEYTSFNHLLNTASGVIREKIEKIYGNTLDIESRNELAVLIYYPEKKYSFYRVGCYDNIYASDRLSVYVELGFKENEEIDVAAEYEKVLADMRVAGLISDHRVVSHCTLIMNPAYVHITSEMEDDKIQKMELLSRDDIYSIGRYGSWIYCSIEDNIKQAKNLAKKLG